MVHLWSKEEEVAFFSNSLKIATPDRLFYKTNLGEYYAYWKKGYKGKKDTLQSRNSFIGSYTEKWVQNLLTPLARQQNAYAVQGMVCEEIGLSKKSPADIALCKTPDKEQKPENILLLAEVKMSIVWNWRYHPSNQKLECVGDYMTHKGTPGLLRSDSMLKAIGKSINIRVSSFESTKIPIVILGNTPIKKSYIPKVDHLATAGIIQGFYNMNPKPLDKNDNRNMKETPEKGFMRIDSVEEINKTLTSLIETERDFFSGMKTRKRLGEIIEIANRESTYEKKAETFLILLQKGNE